MPDVNSFTLKSMFPSARGASIAQNATGVSNRTSQQGRSTVPSKESPSEVDHALSVGGQASPLIGMAVLAVLVVGFMFFAKYAGTDDDFKSIRPTIYNGLTISGIAVVFIPVWKFFFTKVPVPGVSTWVHSV